MSDKISLNGVAHLGIRVHDLAVSRAFYELLGFEFIIGPVGPEPVAIMTHPSGIEINFILNAAESSTGNVLMDVDEKHAGYTHAALRVTSVDDVKAFMDANDIAISGGPIDYPNGARGLFIRDPDRNVVEFYQPGDDYQPQ
jgi:lactoylglutathione lyase